MNVCAFCNTNQDLKIGQMNNGFTKINFFVCQDCSKYLDLFFIKVMVQTRRNIEAMKLEMFPEETNV